MVDAHQTLFSRTVVVALTAALVAAGCGNGAGKASPSTIARSAETQSPELLGAPAVETLSGWKDRGDAIIIATVKQSKRVPIDEPPPHKLYADQLEISVDQTLWMYPPNRPDADLSARTLRLYGQQWAKTDTGNFIPMNGDSAGGDAPRLEVGDHFVASVVFTPDAAKGDWDIFLTGSNTAIPVVDDTLRPGQNAPDYQTQLRGDSIGEFTAAVEAAPEGNHVDLSSGTGPTTTAGR